MRNRLALILAVLLIAFVVAHKAHAQMAFGPIVCIVNGAGVVGPFDDADQAATWGNYGVAHHYITSYSIVTEELPDMPPPGR